MEFTESRSKSSHTNLIFLFVPSLSLCPYWQSLKLGGTFDVCSWLCPSVSNVYSPWSPLHPLPLLPSIPFVVCLPPAHPLEYPVRVLTTHVKTTFPSLLNVMPPCPKSDFTHILGQKPSGLGAFPISGELASSLTDCLQPSFFPCQMEVFNLSYSSLIIPVACLNHFEVCQYLSDP